MANLFRFANHIQNFQTFRRPYSDSRSMLKKKHNEAGGQNKTTKDNLAMTTTFFIESYGDEFFKY